MLTTAQSPSVESPSVEVRGLTKAYGTTAAVDGVDLQVRDGELLALLGPSGCGKTTTLRMLAGIFPPDSGQIVFGGRDVTRLPPEARDVGLVFQHYALFPHKTVYENVAFGLRMRKHPARERKEPVAQMLDRMRLSDLGGRLPAELSGGQRQRVALGRALITRPSVLLLDEPLSNLDANLREEMRFYIRDLVTDFGITTLYVTHDQAEALAMADRVAVMMDGQIAQLGTPTEIYDRPCTPAVASFVGVTNMLAGQVVTTDSTSALIQGAWGTTRTAAADADAGSAVVVSVRPEDITVSLADDTCEPEFRPVGDGTMTRACGILQKVAYLGHVVDYRIAVDQTIVRAHGDPRHPFTAGERVHVEFARDAAWPVADVARAVDGADLAATR